MRLVCIREAKPLDKYRVTDRPVPDVFIWGGSQPASTASDAAGTPGASARAVGPAAADGSKRRSHALAAESPGPAPGWIPHGTLLAPNSQTIIVVRGVIS
jgi:hypothetical protein